MQMAISSAFPTALSTATQRYNVSSLVPVVASAMSSQGNSPFVLIEDWMALFEMATDFRTDAQRKALLSRNVSNEAMQWLVRDVVPIRARLNRTQVKARIIDRFKRSVHNHVEQAIDRVLKPGEATQAYFLEERRLLGLAGQTQENQIAWLTRGLPSKLMKAQVAASRPRTKADWLANALAMENTVKSTDDNKAERKPRSARVDHVTGQSNPGRKGQSWSGQSQPNKSGSSRSFFWRGTAIGYGLSTILQVH